MQCNVVRCEYHNAKRCCDAMQRYATQCGAVQRRRGGLLCKRDAIMRGKCDSVHCKGDAMRLLICDKMKCDTIRDMLIKRCDAEQHNCHATRSKRKAHKCDIPLVYDTMRYDAVQCKKMRCIRYKCDAMRMRCEVMQSEVALTWSLGDGPLLGVEHRHVDRLFRRPEQLHKTHAHTYNAKKKT